MITTIVVGDEAVVARLNAMGPQLQRGLARAVTRLGREWQRKAPAEKLPGQVPKGRTGTLLSSINAKRAFLRKSVMHPGLPERSALREMTPRIEEGLRQAVAEALHRRP
jgi:hypothetical protein